MVELAKSSIKCWQIYSYNGKIEVGPNSTPSVLIVFNLNLMR